MKASDLLKSTAEPFDRACVMVAEMEQELVRLRACRYDLVEHLARQQDFSLRTFGPGKRTKGLIDHITKELAEVAANPDDLFEWVDVILLALDGAWRAGYLPEEISEAINAKLDRNMARTWPDWRTADPGKAVEHVREAPEALKIPAFLRSLSD